MERDMLDFDRFLSEKKKAYVTVSVFGKPYRVRREIPALLPILLARAEAEGQAAEMGKALLKTGDMLFGAENVDGFCRQGMTAEELTELVEQTLALICGKKPENDTETLEDDGSREADGGEAAKK
ncbi:MAG: hypothetical protein IJ214_12370 [Clostridia bacterium]|nr:hypothetical protein [Clostridia bacterium]